MRFLQSLLALTLLTSASAGAASVCKTNGSGLNLRSGSSLNARRLTSLPAGTQFQALSTSANGRWVFVNAAGQTGWLYAAYTCNLSIPTQPGMGGGSNTPITPGTSGGGPGNGSPGSGSPLNGGADPNDSGTVGPRNTDSTGNSGVPGTPGSSSPGSSSPGSSSPGSSSPGSSSPGSSSPGSSSPGSSPGSSSPGSSTNPDGSPSVMASEAECAAPHPSAPIDPLEGIDPFCASCVASRLEALGRTLDDANRRADSVARVQDTLTAVVGAEETGSRNPDYSQITVDSGGITYGAYQADRRSGELAKLIREYVKNATPSPETRALLRHAAMLDGGRGGALDRSRELKQLLKNAANDPVMQKAQGDFFRQNHLEPTLAKAAAAGIRSPLGAAVWLDIQVNGGIDSIVAAAKRIVPRINTAADEARFVRALIDAREARYRRLAANGMRKYLSGWLSRNNDFRKLLNAGNLDLAGNVPLPAKGFSFCGGTTDNAADFRNYMSSLARPS